MVENVKGLALFAAGVVVPVLFAPPKRPPPEGCEPVFAPPNSGLGAGIVVVGVCAGVVELFSAGLPKLKPDPPPAPAAPPKRPPVVAPELGVVLNLKPPLAPPVDAPPNNDGFASPEVAVLLPNRLGPDDPGVFPVLDPKSDGFAAPAEPKRDPDDAPEEAGAPKENFGGSAIVAIGM